ncbi:ADP-L-glycero-D-manno-heptose-6-epimerase [Bacteroidia bacterium]|nr:ADP-L-glycero-D-manno-heptose-6-epimerase [Bacteroidia bacterium]
MKILLTGGSGFIGRNIRESFLSEKYQILAPSSKELNLLDRQSVSAFFSENEVDVVIHAAVKSCDRLSYDQEDVLSNNLRMFYNLESQKKRYKKFLNLGSGAVYDKRRSMEKVKEEDFLAQIPKDMYGFSKYIIAKHIEKEPNFYDLRIFGIFGKYEDYTLRFVSNAICRALCDLPITIKQNCHFDYLYVNDLMSVLDWFIENDPQHTSYNITPDSSISLYELAGIVKDVADKPKLPIQVAEEDLGLEYSGSNSRLKNEFSNLKLTPIRDVVQELYDWYRENTDKINNEVI